MPRIGAGSRRLSRSAAAVRALPWG